MNKFIIIISITVFLIGCITTPPCICPPEDALIGVPIAPGVNLPVGIRKGMLNPENKDHLWFSLDKIKNEKKKKQENITIKPQNDEREVSR